MKDEQTTCTPCEQNFEDNINELVDQVEDYTRKDRMRKEREVEEAFAADKGAEALTRSAAGRPTAEFTLCNRVNSAFSSSLREWVFILSAALRY